MLLRCFAPLILIATAGAQVLDCATSTTVHYKIISLRTWGVNDCSHGIAFAGQAVEGKAPYGMHCGTPTRQGQALEMNCEGSGMKLSILYAKK